MGDPDELSMGDFHCKKAALSDIYNRMRLLSFLERICDRSTVMIVGQGLPAGRFFFKGKADCARACVSADDRARRMDAHFDALDA